MNPHDILMYGHRFLIESVREFPAGEFYSPGAVGYWSVKDVIAHLASFELVLEELLAALIAPAPTPLADELMRDGQAFNDQQVDRLRAERSMEAVMEEYTAAYERAMAMAWQLPPATWRQRGIPPSYGESYDLEDFVVYTYYGHKREHGGQIQTSRDRLARP